MKLIKSVIIAYAILFVSNVHADIFTPTTFCSKPSKPYQFNSEWEVKSYMDSVERYQRCISDFVEKQNREIKNHQQAASNAIDEWNRFVKYEMK